MTLEWLRRQDATFDKFLRRYLFKDADIIEIEEAADVEAAKGEGGGSDKSADAGTKADGSLKIRGLRGA